MITSLFQAPVNVWLSLFGAAILIPLLIHLINLWRYRRVKWAAMEFLLKGQRKKKRRVLIRQILLIASRMILLILAIVFFGQVRWEGEDKGTFREGMVHLVILDDSASMGHLQGTPSSPGDQANIRRANCWNHARYSVLKLVNRLSNFPNQKIIIARTSQLKEPGFESVNCDSNIEEYVVNIFASPPSDKSVSIPVWLEENGDRLPEFDRAYLFSDFRSIDYVSKAADPFGFLRGKSSDLLFVPCANPDLPINNLALEMLGPEHSLTTVGVPFYLTLKISNYSNQTRRNVKIQIRKSVDANEKRIVFSEESGALVPELGPRKSVTIQFPILVHEPGTALLEAELPEDDFAADNSLQTAVEVSNSNRLLLISDRPNSTARYLKWLFEPRTSSNQAVHSGFETETRTTQEIVQGQISLTDYECLFLLSDDLSNPKLIEQLEDYTRQGGVLIFVPGEFADLDQINRLLFRDGQGLISFPIEAEVELPEKPRGITSDIEVVNSQLKTFFQDDSSKLLGMAQFYRKYVPPREWQSQDKRATEILVSIRGRATTPLITRCRFQDGQVYLILSPPNDQWNNWAKNPTFLVLIYQLIYQAKKTKDTHGILVGEELSNSIHSGNQELQFPTEPELVHYSSFDSAANNEPIDDFTPSKRGLYRFKYQDRVNWFGVQIEPKESALDTIPNDELARVLNHPHKSIVSWEKLEDSRTSNNEFSQLYWWLLLLLFLGAEQWLAWSLSFPEGRSSKIDRKGSKISNRRSHE